MKYSIENNGSDTVLIRVYAPVNQASSFLAFIEQKSKENHVKIKSASSGKNEDYLINLKTKAYSLFDDLVKDGVSQNAAISKVNYALKAQGFANVSYDMTKQILSSSGRLKRKSS